MIRFSLTQLFMATALVAIVLTLIRSDGCGYRMARVSDVEFSPDGRRLAVARHDARDARVPFKGYLANVSRTVSVMDAATLGQKRVVEQRVKLGNQGPAFGEFQYAAPSLVFVTDNRLLVAGFGTGPLSEYTFRKGETSPTRPPQLLSGGIWINRDRTLLAVAAGEWVSVLNPTTRERLLSMQTGYASFMDVAMVALSPDGHRLATADWDGIQLRSFPVDFSAPATSIAVDHLIEALQFSPDGTTLMVARMKKIELFDLSGALFRELAIPGRVLDARLSPDGKMVAIAMEDGISVFDAATMKSELRMQNSDWTLCLEFSPDGRTLAGGGRGWVATWDAETGQQRGWTYVPGRVRPPWTLPVAAFIVWLWVYRRIASRRQSMTTVGKDTGMVLNESGSKR